MATMIKKWEECFVQDYPLVKALKKATKSPSVFEHFDVEYDFQRMGLEYYGGIQSKSIESQSNVISLSMLQVIEHNKRKSSKQIDSFDFRLIQNPDGRVCASYSDKFLVPAIVTDPQIKKICKFRARERLPILTFACSGSQGWRRGPNRRRKGVLVARVASADRSVQQSLLRGRVFGGFDAQPDQAQGGF